MTPFETFGPSELLILILLITTLVALKRAKRSRMEGAGATLQGQDLEKQRLHGEVDRLKERLAVLERITVEKENSLGQEIERLRDR